MYPQNQKNLTRKMKIFENQAKPTLTEYHREHQKFGNPLPYAAFALAIWVSTVFGEMSSRSLISATESPSMKRIL